MEGTVGDADSRQEITVSLSLEVLQTRHRQMMRAVDVSPAERGEVLPAAPPPTQALGERDNHSPAGVVFNGVQQLHTRFAVGSGESDHAIAPLGSGTARDEGPSHARLPARDAHERAHENVRALTGATVAREGAESRANREDDHETPRAQEREPAHARARAPSPRGRAARGYTAPRTTAPPFASGNGRFCREAAIRGRTASRTPHDFVRRGRPSRRSQWPLSVVAPRAACSVDGLPVSLPGPPGGGQIFASSREFVGVPSRLG
jgi:hypothetical protein